MRILLGIACLVWAVGLQAAVVVNGTRVIYQQADGEQVVKIRNAGKGPVLVQAWIDTGGEHKDMRSDLDSTDVPFILTPAVSRVDSGRGQVIRVIQTRDDLPSDRESLFWLNVLEIPPAPPHAQEQGNNFLQFTFRTRIKLFYRPRALTNSAVDAARKLRFQINRGVDEAELRLQVINPSPYHLTFRSLDLRYSQDTQAVATLSRNTERMIAPFGELDLELRPATLPPDASAKLSVFFGVINDYGGESRFHTELNP